MTFLVTSLRGAITRCTDGSLITLLGILQVVNGGVRTCNRGKRRGDALNCRYDNLITLTASVPTRYSREGIRETAVLIISTTLKTRVSSCAPQDDLRSSVIRISGAIERPIDSRDRETEFVIIALCARIAPCRSRVVIIDAAFQIEIAERESATRHFEFSPPPPPWEWITVFRSSSYVELDRIR